MITIDLLKNHPQVIPTLALLWQEHLGKWVSDITLETITQWYSEWTNASLPMAYVAFDGKIPVASFSLQWDDGVRPDLFPWLGDLVVSSEYQQRGIGKKLVRFAMEVVQRMGFDTLYLFTFEKTLVEYYAKLGWCVIGEAVYQKWPVTIMKVTL